MKLTPHFTLEELTRSEIAIRRNIDNTPPPAIVRKLERTAVGLERVREALGCRMFVSSGYRAPALNEAVGGAAGSQHMKGEAADFTAPAFGGPRAVCHAIIKARVPFDQLILEGDWVHISFVDRNPRGTMLTAHFEGGPATYTAGIL